MENKPIILDFKEMKQLHEIESKESVLKFFLILLFAWGMYTTYAHYRTQELRSEIASLKKRNAEIWSQKMLIKNGKMESEK